MLVKALRLRHLGERISPEELRRCEPMLGNLRVEQDQLRRLATRGSRMALLMPLGGTCEPLAQLHSARLILVDHRGLVIQGVEESWRRKQCTDHRQALWCWPVDPREAAQHDGRDAIDLEEETACIGDASDPVWGKAQRSIDEGDTGMPLLPGQTRRIDCSTSDPVAARRASMRSVGPNPGANWPEETGVGARVKVWSAHMGSREK